MPPWLRAGRVSVNSCASAFKDKKAYITAAGRVDPLSGLRWAFLPDRVCQFDSGGCVGGSSGGARCCRYGYFVCCGAGREVWHVVCVGERQSRRVLWLGGQVWYGQLGRVLCGEGGAPVGSTGRVC